MAKVSLRLYNREIEGMIEAGQLDESIAHCEHILKTFPMHVETYLLLGKAFLEGRRYSDAADIFERVIMALPDNFVSHVGMSIIRDDEGKLDEAIWHMERAFEIQPSNPAIQGELRRLYGRRDGVEPPKIRLSREALANMYAQGELFNQAIAEIRGALAEDNNRADLEVMLARAYFRAGQKVEAAGMASTLLKRYSYCMDALRILVDVLPGTSRSDDTQVYLQRLSMLDPYATFANGSSFNSDKVPDSAVTMEKLDYRAGAPHIETQPNWASSLGIQLPGEKTPGVDVATRPATAQQPFDTNADPFAGIAGLEATGPASGDENVPEWMRSAGWHESNAGATTETPAQETAEPAEPIAEADIPDWLSAIAPKQVNQTDTGGSTEEAVSPPANEAENPDWLKGIVQPAGMGSVSSEPEPTTEAALPPMEAAGKADASDSGIGQKNTDAVLPPLLEGEPTPNVGAENEDLPAWLDSLASKDGSEGGSVVPETGGDNRESSLEPKGVTDFLKSMSIKELKGVVPAAPAPMPVELTPATENDGMPDWLKAMAPKDADTEKSLYEPGDATPPPATKNEEMPDWLRSMAPKGVMDAEPAATEPAAETPPATGGSESSPDWLKGLGTALVEDAGDSNGSRNEPEAAVIPDWLAKAGASAESKVSAGATEADVPVEAPVEPVAQDVNETPQEEPVPAAETAALNLPEIPLETIPHLVPTIPAATGPETGPRTDTGELFQPSGDVRPVNIEDDTLAWLENLATKHGAKEEEMLTSPEIRAAEMAESASQAGTAVEEPGNLSADGSPLEQFKSTQDEVETVMTPLAREEPLAELTPLPGSLPTEAGPQPIEEQDATAEPAPAVMAEPTTEKKTAFLDDPSLIKNPATEAPADVALEPASPEAVTPESVDVLPGSDITITSWLSKMDVEEAVIKARANQPGGQPAEPTSALPDWLKDLDKPTPPPPASEPMEETSAESDLPDWLKEPVKPSSAASVTPAPVEPAPEGPLPSWMDETMIMHKPPVPTAPGEWVPADAAGETGASGTPGPASAQSAEAGISGEPAAEPAATAVPPVVHLARSSGTGMLSNIPTQDKDGKLLMAAQVELDNNNLSEAMKTYLSLIKKGKLLEEVIHDLREALYRYPVDIIVWQTLGDAYMRTNQLQDALDAYTKAEELLR